MSKARPSWHEFAWAGVGCQAPKGMEPAVLDKDYFRLDQRDGVRLEVKWQPIRRDIKPEALFRRMAKKLCKGADMITEPGRLPPEMKGVISRLQGGNDSAHGFSWQGNGYTARGVVIHHAGAGLALMAQMVWPTGMAAPPWPALLSSLQCRDKGSDLRWRVFDLAITTPAGYVLLSHSFLPGHFKLEVARGKHSLSFNRLGPADMILKDSGLAAWTRSFLTKGKDKSELELSPLRFMDYDAVSWERKKPRNLLARLKKQQGAVTGLIWHAPEHNKLLSVQAGGGMGLDDLKEICRDYEIIQE